MNNKKGGNIHLAPEPNWLTRLVVIENSADATTAVHR